MPRDFTKDELSVIYTALVQYIARERSKAGYFTDYVLSIGALAGYIKFLEERAK